jgi:beta-lactamase class D
MLPPMLRQSSLALLCLLLVLTPALSQPKESVQDLRSYFHGLHGAFVVYDQHANRWIRYQPEQCRTRYSPASTFKIPNSLIGLETGVIRDQHFVIPWDSIHRSMETWNRDHDLQSAIANSVVWYYQELARRVGEQRMKDYVEKIGYGNMDISGGIDRFWLGSTIEISADEQVDFLRRLQANALPFSVRSMEIVRDILVLEKTDRYTLRGKTGFTTFDENHVIGWFVGYVQTPQNCWFFALNIVSDNAENDSETIFRERKPISIQILKGLGIL